MLKYWWVKKKKLYSWGQFICFPINNWESWFLKVFPGHMALKLHRHYLNCSHHWGILILSSREEDMHAYTLASKPLRSVQSATSWNEALNLMHLLPFDFFIVCICILHWFLHCMYVLHVISQAAHLGLPWCSLLLFLSFFPLSLIGLFLTLYFVIEIF